MKNFIKKIFILNIFLGSFFPIFVLAETYNLMGVIPGLEPAVETGNVTAFIIQLYNYAFGIGVALAVLMIVWGGVGYTLRWTEYIAIDSKNKITNAIIGLVILFTSWLLLSTINPRLVDFNLKLDKGCTSSIKPNSGSSSGNTTIGTGGTGGLLSLSGNTELSGPIRQGETASEALLRNAKEAANPSNPLITDSRVGCAAAVNQIAQVTLGQPIGGGASTEDMARVLAANKNEFTEVKSPQPGDIVITPNGHVGVWESGSWENNGSIISNSSNQGRVARTINPAYWEKTYGKKEDGKVLFYHINDSASKITIKTPTPPVNIPVIPATPLFIPPAIQKPPITPPIQSGTPQL